MDATESKIRTGRPRSETAQRAILEATLELLQDRGLKDFAIETVAAHAGVGKATIYRWWPSRLDLMLEAMDTLPPLRVPDTGTFLGDLRILIADLGHVLNTTPLSAVLAHIMAENAARESGIAAFIANRMAGAQEAVARAKERGELPADADTASVLHMVFGPVMNKVFFGDTPLDDAFVELVARSAVIGIPAALAQREVET